MQIETANTDNHNTVGVYNINKEIETTEKTTAETNTSKYKLKREFASVGMESVTSAIECTLARYSCSILLSLKNRVSFDSGGFMK